jgi:hypothetical protein
LLESLKNNIYYLAILRRICVSFVKITKCLFYFKSTKEVFGLQGVWHSPKMLTNIVYDQMFRAITWHPHVAIYEWENWNNLFWRKDSLVIDPHFRDVGQRIAVFVVSFNWSIFPQNQGPSSRLRVVWRQMTQLWKLTDLSTKIVISMQRTPFNKYQYHVQIVKDFWFLLLQKTAQLFGFSIFWLWAWIMKVIPETCWIHYIRYLRFNSQAFDTNINITYSLINLKN